jgi:hypothetical protein
MTEGEHRDELIDILKNATPYGISGRSPSLAARNLIYCIRLSKDDLDRLLDCLGVDQTDPANHGI